MSLGVKNYFLRSIVNFCMSPTLNKY